VAKVLFRKGKSAARGNGTAIKRNSLDSLMENAVSGMLSCLQKKDILIGAFGI
jgi:hypothetical protein